MSRRRLTRAALAAAAASFAIALLPNTARADDVSAPAILQWFEGSWQTIGNRMPDYFMAGYGGLWTPPPSRADSGNQSVGYDVYDRFDLGSPGNPTLYGTETGLKTMIAELHKTGGRSYIDLVWNHDGFRDSSTPGFAAQGGYPGFVLNYPGTTDGDFHSAFASGDQDGRLAGLIDIDQSTNIPLVRNPVPGNPNNIPAGTVANIPTDTNRQFYPDTSQTPIIVNDPATGATNIAIYPFNPNNPSAGTPVAENALGYLMRNAQWLIQDIGADGFRLDATKNYPARVLNYYDRAVFDAIQKPLLDGSKQQAFAFGEYFDDNKAALQSVVRKDINPATPNVVGGNRDTLDFPLKDAMDANLSSNGLQNDWRNVTNASFDSNDDGLANNGSQGVSFVSSADNTGAYLSNVAYAYTLTRPGNTIVYFNAHEFGTDRSFPQDGRGDALGGVFGKTITTLVDIRNRYGRGDYIERDLEKEVLVYERSDSMIVALNNRLDSGFDSRTVHTNFAPGTPLVELTGNAADPTVDPNNDIPEVVVVNPDGTINFRVPRNKNVNGVEDDKGYVIYGPSGPQGHLSLSNVAMTLAPDTATASNNGTARLTPIDVVKSDAFQVQLQTNRVNLLGSIRDIDADGDNALIKIDGGIDINNDGHIDFVAPNTVTYGFETFKTKASPLWNNPTADGQFLQNIDTTKLSEGLHYIDVIAFRHRDPSEPAIYSEFKDVIYVDRLKPVSAVDSFDPIVTGTNENRRVQARSVDQTANNIHVFLDLGASLTDAQVLSLVGANSQGTQIDTDLWTKDFSGLTSGNHVITLVTYEMDGNYNIQRLPGYAISTIFGAGLGDLNFDGHIDTTDVNAFESLYDTHNAAFNPAADFDPDGVITRADVYAFGAELRALNASPATLAAYNTFAATVPEPTTLFILAPAAALLLTRRRRRT